MSERPPLPQAGFQFLNDLIPPHDQHIRWNSLAPSPKSQMPESMQAEVIAAMQERWHQGWAFFGPAGWSKTTFSTALLRKLVAMRWDDIVKLRGDYEVPVEKHVRRCKVRTFIWRLPLSELFDEFKNWEFRTNDEVFPPRVRREVIRAYALRGYPVSLFLEEADKVKGTKWKLDILFEILNALYEYKGQLVLTSNFTPEEFTEAFGPEFARRVGEMCNVVNCFTQEVKLKGIENHGTTAVKSNA